MIEFIMNNFWQIACSVLAILTAIVFSFECYVRKEYNKVVKKYLESLAKQLEYCYKISDLQNKSIYTNDKYLSLLKCASDFVNEHNSWHDRKIAFYYDKDGWHCLYADEIPQGNVVSEQEEINTQNENNDENNQSI